jgi:hypothetical protein
MAALGHWSRLHERVLDPASDGDGARLARAELPAAAAVAVGLTAATPFWLPPGQTAGYVDSEPLSEADRADVRLPFPQVLVALADPIHLPPTKASTTDAGLDHTLSELDHGVVRQQRSRAKDNPTLLDVVREVADSEVWDKRPQLADVIAARGALVEGVLLLGDALGKPSDTFAWCLAVPALTGGVLGRWVVPARCSRSAFSDQIVNLAAVAAWADWHAPDRELEVPPDVSGRKLRKLVDSPDFKRLEERGGAGGVCVLNVKRTSGDRATGNDGPGRTVAPHVRRGHWRRQYHGPGRQLVKRIRITPVLVNAGRSGIAPRVYRLPIDDTTKTR